jgi:hypothetical protein
MLTVLKSNASVKPVHRKQIHSLPQRPRLRPKILRVTPQQAATFRWALFISRRLPPRQGQALRKYASHRLHSAKPFRKAR